jgi:hypothetical protein
MVPNTAGTACETITENSCLTWASASSCETCPTGKILKDEGGNKVCGDFTIDNCAVVNTEDLACDACSAGFYKTSNTTCAAVTTTITNCLVYSSAELCGECDPTYMLSTAKNECKAMGSFSNLPITNCSTGHEIALVAEGETDPGFCYECNGGYFKEDGKCKECGVKNCRYCDPSDSSECHVCNSGYFMSEEGKCMSNTGDDDDDDTPTTPVDDKSVSLPSLLSFAVILLTFFRND